MSVIKSGIRGLEIIRDIIDVTTAIEPDPTWRFVDGNGHEHRWREDARQTWEFVVDGYEFDEDGEKYPVGHQQCVFCGETVEPGYRAVKGRVYMAGRRHYFVDGEEVTMERFEKVRRERGL